MNNGMRRPESVFALAVSVFCAMFLYFSWKIDLGSMDEPKAGFMPLLVGVMGLGTGLILFLSSLRDTEDKTAEPIPIDGKQRFIGCLLSSIIFIPVFEFAGASMGIFLLVLALTKVLGAKGWLQPIILAVMSSVIAYVLFFTILDVPLPRGLF